MTALSGSQYKPPALPEVVDFKKYFKGILCLIQKGLQSLGDVVS